MKTIAIIVTLLCTSCNSPADAGKKALQGGAAASASASGVGYDKVAADAAAIHAAMEH
jgi:hypothetical protein